MATIKEIAALAGVSRGTVDRVLNNRGSVNADTAKKIREIADSLDYKPNRAGLVLAAHKKNLKLGVILFSPENPFFQDVLEGVREKEQELSGYNCTVIVRQVPFGVEEQIKAIDELLALDIHGLAIAPYNDPRIRSRINKLHRMGIPVVTLNTDIEDSKRLAYVGSNYTKSGETAAGLLRLMTTGEVHAGIIYGSSSLLCHSERVAGFIQALAPYTERIHIAGTVETDDDEQKSYEKTLQLLQEYPEINALYLAGASTNSAFRSITDAGSQGKICIITHDLLPLTRKLLEDGTISATICQQPRLQGRKPLDILFSYLTTGELPEKELYHVAVDIRIKENI